MTAVGPENTGTAGPDWALLDVNAVETMSNVADARIISGPEAPRKKELKQHPAIISK